MTFRARLSLTALESRENPSVPSVDPFGGEAPTWSDPPPSPTPGQLAEEAAVAGATIPPAAPPADPFGTNSIYGTPLLP